MSEKFATEKTVTDLLKMVKLLSGEVRHLRQLVHLEHAKLRAIHIYCVAKIADLSDEDRKTTFAHVTKMIQELYDEAISELEKNHPAVAGDIDIRGTLSASEQQDWYLLEKYYPKDGDQPGG